jgi:hypothetical protein
MTSSWLAIARLVTFGRTACFLIPHFSRISEASASGVPLILILRHRDMSERRPP